MNLIIQQFIEKTKDWRANFKIEVVDEKVHYGESAKFLSYLNIDKDKAANYALSLYNKALNLGYFEMTHPLFKDIKARAVKSYLDDRMGWKKFVHYIFMIDEKKEKPFVIFQQRSFIDWIFAEDKIISYSHEPAHMHEGTTNLLYQLLDKDKALINEEFDYFNPGKLVFLIDNYRPWHFFTEDLYGAFKLNEMNEKFTYTQTHEAFFAPKSFKAVPPREDYILFKPTCVFEYGTDEVFKRVYNEALEDKEKLVETDNLKQDYELTLWLGLPGERRAWLEQVEGTAQILKNLSRYFKKIKVYVDGMTAYDGERKEYPENKNLFNHVLNTTKELFNKEIKDLDNENASKENWVLESLALSQESLNPSLGGGE